MKRVLFLQSQTYFGADSAIHAQLMRHLNRDEVEVYVACNAHADTCPKMTVLPRLQAIPNLTVRPTYFGPTVFQLSPWERITRALREGPKLPLELLRLAAYIKRHQIQVIHGTEKPRDAFYGVLLGKLTGAKSVVHMHVRYAQWLSPAVKWALKNADAVVGVSEFVSRTVIEAGIPAQRVHTVVNALDLAEGEWDLPATSATVREELGIPADALLVGVCSRLFRWKGHVELIDAVAKVLPQLPNLRLMIVGDDDSRANPGGGSFRAELEAQIDRLGIADKVLFTGFRQDIPRLMGALDIFAMPSFEEPLGMVYLEAMALGKPVIGYASGGVPEIVQNGVSGLLTEPYDIAALARSLHKLGEDANLRREMGEAGRDWVHSEATSQKMCTTMLGVYRAVISGVKTHVFALS